MECLCVPGSLDSLGKIAEYVMSAAASAGLDQRTSYRLRSAVDEIVTNIILHGYTAAGRQGDLHLKSTVDDKALTISVEDTGVTYDPRQIPPPDNLDIPLEQRPIGGLGIYLALQNVDQFQYERVGDHNRSTFVVNRKTFPAAG